MLEFASLSFHEVPTEQSEDEARSPTDASLLAIGSLSFGKVAEATKRNEKHEPQVMQVYLQ